MGLLLGLEPGRVEAATSFVEEFHCLGDVGIGPSIIRVAQAEFAKLDAGRRDLNLSQFHHPIGGCDHDTAMEFIFSMHGVARNEDVLACDAIVQEVAILRAHGVIVPRESHRNAVLPAIATDGVIAMMDVVQDMVAVETHHTAGIEVQGCDRSDAIRHVPTQWALAMLEVGHLYLEPHDWTDQDEVIVHGWGGSRDWGW